MDKKKKPHILFRALRIGSKMLGVILVLIFLMVALLNIPAVQIWLTQKITNQITENFGVEVQVGSVMVAIPNTVQIRDLYIPGQSEDTLLYLGALKADVSLFRLINRKVQVRYFSLENLTANVRRGPPGEDFNFNFLLEVFASESDTTAQPDTIPAEPWGISIDKINLKDIDAVFLDETLGMDARLNLGNLEITLDELDLAGPVVMVDRIELADTYVSFEQWIVEQQETAEAGALVLDDTENNTEPVSAFPQAGLNALLLENVKFDYFDRSSKMKLNYETGHMLIEPGETDLTGKQLVVENIEIAKTKAFVELASDTTTSGAVETTIPNSPEGKSAPAFVFLPGWEIEVKKVNFEEMEVGFDDVHAPPVESGLDFAHLHFKNINIDIENVILSDSIAEAQIRQVAMEENSGLILDHFQLEAKLTPKQAAVKRLSLKLNETEFGGDISANYEDFGLALADPGNVDVNIDLLLKHLKPDLITMFAGTQIPDAAFAEIQQKQISLELKAEGKVDRLLLDKLKIDALDHTRMLTSGKLNNLTSPDDLTFELRFDTLRTGKSDLMAILGAAIPQNINLPESFSGKLDAKGSMAGGEMDLSLNTDFGAIGTKALFARQTQQQKDTFAVQLSLKKLDLGEILKNDQLGEVSLAMNASGSGLESGAIRANVQADVIDAFFNDYEYDDIRLEANMLDSLIWVKIVSEDPGAQFVFETSASVDSTVRDISLRLNLKNLNLQALNFTNEEMTVKTNLELTGDFLAVNNLNGNLILDNSVIISEGDAIPVQDIRFRPEFTPEQTNIEFTSGILNFHFYSNIPFDEFENVVIASLNQYLNRPVEHTVDPEKTLEFRASIQIPKDLKSYFDPDLNDISIDTIIGQYHAADNRMDVKMKIPVFDYAGALLENLQLDLNGLNDSLLLTAGFDRLTYDSLYVNGLSIIENLHAGKLISDISLRDEHDSTIYRFINKISMVGKDTRLSFVPDGLVINGNAWDVSDDNSLLISDSGWVANEFVFSSDQQKAGVVFDNQTGNFFAEQFQLSNLLGIVQNFGRDNLASGDLDLDISIPFNRKYDGIQADINIQNLYVLDSLLGNLTFKLEERTDELALDFKIEAIENQLNAFGTIGKSSENQSVDLDIDFDISNPARYEAFAAEYASNLSGSISGNFKLDGQLSSPAINGELQFNESRVTINLLNTEFYLPNEQIGFNNSDIVFNDFDIFDSNDDKLNVNGKLFTNNFNKFEFDLNVSTRNFRPINSSKSDNSFVYGSLVIDADVDLEGNLDLPVVNASLAIKEGTDISYVLPGSEIEIVSSENVVNFVNPVADTLYTSAEGDYLTDSILSKVVGIDMTAKLKLSPKAKFTVVIDPYSGDYASLQGSANMNLSVDPSGSTTLTGVYEVADGVYQLSFYGLVKKTFEFEPGSSIAWSGRPMDANMNFTAKHVVRTQSVALVANESTGMTEAEKNMFKQRLPYEVLLNLRGFLDQPDVSFRIELPEKYQINYPQIASKLNMLNSGQNESDLNKQVFALLVTGSFIADNPFASSGGTAESFATTAARNSVNGILAQQLNNVSSRYIKGVDLNFGLTTYEDYQGSSSETRTELDVQVSKKLLDERLTVEASGSFDVEGNRQYTGTTTSHTYGEFSATYDLTESREYKLRAYHENAYDLFDGEISYSGIAFIIEKSFDTLFKRTKPKDPGNQEGVKPEAPQPEEMEEDK